MSTIEYDRPLRTVAEVARELSVSRETVYRAISRGELDAVRLGETGSLRIPDEALERFLRPTSRDDR